MYVFRRVVSQGRKNIFKTNNKYQFVCFSFSNKKFILKQFLVFVFRTLQKFTIYKTYHCLNKTKHKLNSCVKL